MTEARNAADRERPTAWVAATLIVLACTGFVRYQNTPNRSLGDIVGVPRQEGPELLAVAVFQLADCTEAGDFLRVFSDEEYNSSFEVRGIVVGSGDDLQRAAARLGSDLESISLRRAGRRDMLALDALGYDATPYVLIVDRAGRLRWTGGPPQTPAEWVRLRASVRALTASGKESV